MKGHNNVPPVRMLTDKTSNFKKNNNTDLILDATSHHQKCC